MAFNADYLTCVCGISNTKPQLWLYKTEDAAAAVDTAGYFETGYGFKVGDVVIRITVTNLGASNEAVAASGMHLVSGVSSTQVDVSDALAFTATDTD